MPSSGTSTRTGSSAPVPTSGCEPGVPGRYRLGHRSLPRYRGRHPQTRGASPGRLGHQRRREVLARFLDGVTLLSLDDGICDRFGLERGRRRQQRMAIGDFDLLIAVTCLRHDLKLCSNNRRHFEMVEGLEIVSVA